jgi:hypothetical protein
MTARNVVDKVPLDRPSIPSHPSFVDLAGKRFGRLTVVAYAYQKGNSYWYVECDCGVLKVNAGSGLQNGTTRSCGCYNRDALSKNKRTHGHSVNRKPTAEFSAYYGAKQRCNDPNNKSFARYGGRGIEFRFDSLEQFLEGPGSRPSVDHWLTRIDPDGHYEPGNVRWAYKSEAAGVRSERRVICVRGQSRTLVEWTELTGIKYNTIRYRQARGWCGECSISHFSRCRHRQPQQSLSIAEVSKGPTDDR